jgi:hypothetical protein
MAGLNKLQMQVWGQINKPIEEVLLSYAPSTILYLAVTTTSGQDWEIDWGDGIWVRYSSSLTLRLKNYFGVPTSGVARVRSAVGNPRSDLSYFTSQTGNWNFDISVFSEVTVGVSFQNNTMTIHGNISALSNVTDRVYFVGNNINLTGNISALSNVVNSITLVGPMALTGNISAFSNLNNVLFLQGIGFNLTGNISSLSNIGQSVRLIGNNLNLTGNVGSLNNVSYYIILTGTKMDLTYSPTVWVKIPSIQFVLSLKSGRLAAPAEVDNLIIDMNVLGSSGSTFIDFRYNNAPPTGASATAKAEMISRGYNLNTY